MNNVAIIPARGGSKRIPRKNIRDFLGKPIIAYSIEAALQSGLFDEVMVSTDDEEIMKVALQFGAMTPYLRSDKNSDDFSTTSDVICEVLDEYKNSGRSFNYACCIYPTAPFITAEKLLDGFHKIIDEKRKSVFPVVPFTYPVWRGLKKTKNGSIDMVWPEHVNSRSQDLEEIYHDAGQWYWFQVEAFQKEKKLFTDNSAPVILSPIEVQDIDSINDWVIAEIKYRYLNK